METFDIKAREWDNNPEHHERSKAIAEKILTSIPINTSMKAMELGAGTGILSFLLKDKFEKILLMDSSPEMVRVCQEKIVQATVTNLFPVLCDLEKENFYTEAFDVIFSQMVFHHIRDIRSIVKKLYLMLKEGGYIAIADLYKEDGTFHEGSFNGHQGFEPEELKKVFESVGFKSLSYEPCYSIQKTIGTVRKSYPIFLLIGSK
ncbi:MAG: class I SAM-dependent methyltransferase [Bacteroidales bacterium]|nr:class I SAM-dependent methyltransferase [Bacteroidales bacterium]